MTNSEIIDALDDITWNGCDRYEKEVMIECRSAAISALEKQMPKKPELKLGIYFCSECGNSFNDDMNENYCNCCGQAIDWSEDDDK